MTILASSTGTLLASPASASLVYNSGIYVTAQGFGNVNRDLSIDNHAQNTTESGCISVAAGGSIQFGSSSCIANGSVHDSNGVANTGGDEANPTADNQKHGIPTVAELGWASAADIGLLFNAIEPSGDSVTVNDITLKFYNSTTGALIAAIDNLGAQTFDPSQQGNGSAGFVFIVDGNAASGEQNFLNTLIFNQLGTYGGAGNIRIALESSMSNVAAGTESWTAFNLNSPPGVPEPATWAMMLLGFGGIGMAMRRSRRRNGALLQVA